jgi:hypothetical protein
MRNPPASRVDPAARACATRRPAYVGHMKFPAVLLSAVIAVGVMGAQTKPVAKPADAQPAPGKEAPAAKKEEKKVEVVPKIPGTEIARANGTFLGLELKEGKFKLTFYDKKKKPMAVDVTRATARWPNNRSGTPSDYRTVLNGSGTALLSEKYVLPPHIFNVTLTLLQGEGDEAKAVETYVIPFRG